jgi:TolA-binding protein
MAKTKQRGLVDRLADAGEEAIQRLGTPGSDRLVGAVGALRGRMDEMQNRMRALATIEKRLTTIERRLDKLEGKTTSTARSSVSRSSTPRTKKTADSSGSG